ncbi:hypothetical protein ABZ249_24370 [Nocardiopsis sp. NPDC006139]|uniref:hypothetical protein n=1 Tax=Nocardiopsis sp. NPDC006139 TaxID=3154578 RepID=UPI0033B1CD34
MDGRTGNGRLRPSAVLGDLARAAVPPLLPAGLSAAAACAALSAEAATGTPVSPVLPVLALVALVAGAPVSVAAVLLVGAAAVLGRRADPAGVRRRAVRAAPAVLLWAVLLAAPAAALLFLDPAPWHLVAAAAVLLPLLPALLLAVPVSVVTGRPLHRVLPATLTPRGLRALLGGLRSAIPDPGRTADRPSIAAPVPVALLLGTVVVSGAAWGAAGPGAQAPDGPETVHIEASDGVERRFSVDLAVPDEGSRADARIGDHQVDAFWRSGPAEGAPTLYLRVCPVTESCEDGAPRALDVTATGPESMRLVLLTCAETGCPDTGSGGAPESGPGDADPDPLPPADAVTGRSTPAPATGAADPSCTPPGCTPRA